MLNFSHEGILISSKQDRPLAQGKGILFRVEEHDTCRQCVSEWMKMIRWERDGHST